MTNLNDSLVLTHLDTGMYRGIIDPAWDVFGPNGGYLSSVVYAAMAGDSAFDLPAAFYCQYFRPGRHGPCDIAVEVLRKGTNVEVLRATMLQEGKVTLAATVTMVRRDLKGLEHSYLRKPDVPEPEQLQSYDTLAEEFETWQPYWKCVEARPCIWPELPEPGPAVWRAWIRLREQPCERSVAFDVGRVLLWTDLAPLNAAMAGNRWPSRWIAPNLDLYVQYHHMPTSPDWLLAEATSAQSANGLVAGATNIWDRDGRLIASSASQLLCIANPMYESQLEWFAKSGR